MNIKKIFTKVLVVLAACFMFASFSPSLDGRAVVVEPGVFPQGLFAKTVGYLPGDIISVANISGETTTDLLVIGALDPSEGVAIMLSPEAADAIGIDKDANNIVKITKRSGQDERVYGTAIIAKQNFSTAENEIEPLIEESNEDAFEAAPAEEFNEEIAEEEFDEELPEEYEEEAVAEEDNTEDFEELAATEDEDFDEAFAEDESEEEDFEEEIAEEEFEEESEEIEEDEFEEEFDEESDDEDYEEEFSDYEDQFDDEEEWEDESDDDFVEEDFEEEPFDEAEEDEDFEEENTLESEEIEEEIAAPFDEEETEAETDEAYDYEDTDESEDEQEEEEFFEDEYTSYEESVDEDIPELPYEETKEPEVEDELIEDSDEDDIDAVIESELEDYEEYEAIVLVPVDAMPPVNEYVDTDEVEDVIEEASETEEVESVEEENEAIVIEPVPSPAPIVNEPVNVQVKEDTKFETPKTTGSYEKYLVGSLADLKSGKYYIQIAALSTDENIMEIVNKYGNNYPITIVPMAGGVRKQVLIGPLSMDEYAVVLERFKSYGYKDAFLRKIK